MPKQPPINLRLSSYNSLLNERKSRDENVSHKQLISRTLKKPTYIL